MREKELERKLSKYVKSIGGMCPKLVCPGTDGMPDRLVLFPDGRAGFVEVKAPKGSVRPLQAKRHRELTALGFQVFVLNSEDDIPEVARAIKEGR